MDLSDPVRALMHLEANPGSQAASDIWNRPEFKRFGHGFTVNLCMHALVMATLDQLALRVQKHVDIIKANASKPVHLGPYRLDNYQTLRRQLDQEDYRHFKSLSSYHDFQVFLKDHGNERLESDSEFYYENEADYPYHAGLLYFLDNLEIKSKEWILIRNVSLYEFPEVDDLPVIEDVDEMKEVIIKYCAMHKRINFSIDDVMEFMSAVINIGLLDSS